MSDSKDSRFPEAEYKNQGLPEYNENPLISALPTIMSPVAVARALAKRPHFQAEELNLPCHIRTHAIHRLTRDFFVPQTNHIVIEQKLSKLIRCSYLNRNPKTATFKRKLNSVRDLVQKEDLTAYIHDEVDSPASSMTIAGISGAGKSTTTNLVLNTYPRVIYHPEFHMLQVPWLKVDCPHDGSLSDFCLSFFIALGRRLNIDYRAKYASGRPTIGKMMADVADLCLIHAIGLIVIDEFQHMSLAKSGGEKKMINFLVTLVNVVEVSVVLIGTPKALRLFASEFRQARRASGDGSVVWDRLPFDESWEDFLTELWPYQWLKHKVERDEQLTNKLYELSQGVPDIVVKLFCLAQFRAILLAGTPEEERLSSELIEQVFEDEFSIVKPMLEALRFGNRHKIEECNDLIFPKFESNMINAVNQLVTKPLGHTKKVELGEPMETNIANTAIKTIVSMGIAEDIAQPLVADALAKDPNLKLIQIIQLATTALTDTEEKPEARDKPDSKPVYTSRSSWAQLSSNDLRKMHADKSGSMYEVIQEKGIGYPIQELLAG
ncbi:Tn7-like transposition protein C [Hahella chejuensis KCTC 2396]|uniref:Tn7-like transposition protein C n=1 Tax=Hahella chejuensis (strain KCTC 2396) TaxID=349521 RepID=Q2S6P7_HAHCH|nr:ATP-binding protein [Hahella chejuensis]ABC33677.1 Tn7-like transposition protein C [Hahella chejuensis KCTC 2396]